MGALSYLELFALILIGYLIMCKIADWVTNSEDPYQTALLGQFGLGLHCLFLHVLGTIWSRSALFFRPQLWLRETSESVSLRKHAYSNI